MDVPETQNEASSSKTVILWKNEQNPLHESYANACPSHGVWHPYKDNEYRTPQGLSEHYLYYIKKTANDMIDRVIADSLWVVGSTKSKASSSSFTNVIRQDELELKIISYRQKCINRPMTPDLDHPLLSTSTWLSKNGTFYDQAALERIVDYIKQNWDLDAKYLFTVEKTDTSMICGLTCHSYKAEFSVPTKEYPIPQVTVSAYFTVEIAPSFPIIYMKYHLESDRRAYVIGEHTFNKKRFEHLFEMKRDAYMDVNRYPGWSSSSSSGPSRRRRHKP